MAADISILAAFGGGMLSFLSPCVLPLVPGYLSLMSGVSVAELYGERPAGDGDGAGAGGVATATVTATATVAAATRATVLRSTLLFVAGFTVVFVALGASASAVGTTLQEHRRGLDQIAGLLVIAMGVFMAGLVSPRMLVAERRFHVSPSRLGVFGAPVMGMAFAFGWTPCIGSILGPLLALASTQDTVARGAGLLAVYSLGLGVPFVASGLALSRLTTVFALVKRHHRAVNLVAGLLLVAFGVLLLTNRLSWLSGQFSDLFNLLDLDRLATS